VTAKTWIYLTQPGGGRIKVGSAANVRQRREKR